MDENEDAELTLAQWEAIENRLDSDELMTPHDEVVREFRNRVS